MPPSINSRAGLFEAALLALSVAGCAGTPVSPAVPDELDAEDVAVLADGALARYDVALLGALVDVELAHLSASEAAPGLSRLQRLARLAHRLADTLKFEATCLPAGEAREAVVRARLDLAGQALTWLEPGLSRNPEDSTLAFAVGELLAFRIDGVLSGMTLGGRSRETLERALNLGAGADAELALARRYYYLPTFAGGDLARAEAAVGEVLARHPEHEPSWAFLGEVLHLRGDADGARSALQRAQSLNAHSPRALALLSDPHLVLAP